MLDFYKARYFDYAASTPMDPEVQAVFFRASELYFGNPSSAAHSYGWAAREAVEVAREQVADLLGASAEQIFFFPSATIANNVVISSQTCTTCCFATEHSSVLEAVKHKKDHKIISDISELPDKSFLSKMLVNNETGDVYELPKVDNLHCDASQAGGKVSFDVNELGVDYLTLSSHKMYGPKGAAALYVKEPDKLNALYFGGGQEKGLSAGTINAPAIAAFGKACTLEIRHTDFRDKIISGIKALKPDMVINEETSNNCGFILNVRLPGIKNANLVSKINGKIALSTGSACSSDEAKPSHVLLALGLSKEEAEESVRVSFGRFTSEDDVVQLLKNIEKCISSLEQ